MNRRTVRAVVKRVGLRPEIIEIETRAEELRTIVGGHVANVLAFKAPGTEFSIICYANKEGEVSALPLNFYRPIDREPIAGDVVFVGDVAGERVGLSLETADQLVRLIRAHGLSTDQELVS